MTKGVEVHGRVCQEAMLPLHQLCVEQMGLLQAEAAKLAALSKR